jgi:prepilin-type N-terminal cleavage/methylation domain-containing protein
MMQIEKIMRHRRGNDRGFTLIEIIAVLIILAIISAVAVPRIIGTSDSDLSSQVEVVKNHIRYAQTRAMNTDAQWGINFSSATTYYLFQGVGSTTPVLLPGEDNATVNLTTKKSALTITPPTGGSVTFDSYGSPGSATTTITTNGGTITVTRNTGFIP